MRSYESTPRPEIEQHWHIRELIETQERRSDDRTYHRDRIKALEERKKLIQEAKSVTLTDFWCNRCKKDFKSLAYKQVEQDWNANQEIAFYKTKHFCGSWCIRLITDKLKDGFWVRSRFLALDRGNHFADTIQPHETGFNLLYGRKNK